MGDIVEDFAESINDAIESVVGGDANESWMIVVALVAVVIFMELASFRSFFVDNVLSPIKKLLGSSSSSSAAAASPNSPATTVSDSQLEEVSEMDLAEQDEEDGEEEAWYFDDGYDAEAVYDENDGNAESVQGNNGNITLTDVKNSMGLNVSEPDPEPPAQAAAAVETVAAAPVVEAAPVAAAEVPAAGNAAQQQQQQQVSYKQSSSLFTGLSRDRQNSRFYKEQRSRNLTKSTTCQSFLDAYKKCEGCKTSVSPSGKVQGSSACEKGCAACGHGLFR